MAEDTSQATQPWHIASRGLQETWLSERCYVTEIVNTDQLPDVSLALVRVEPGVTTQLHALHGVEEVYAIQAGRGLMEIDGTTQTLSVGDQAIVAAGAAQRITNLAGEDLMIFCICRPRFQSDCYENLDADSDED